MNESKTLYALWKGGEIETVKALLENIDYWQTDLLLLKMSLTNPSDILDMCRINGYSEMKYYFETYEIIKNIRLKKFKNLSFADKLRAFFI